MANKTYEISVRALVEFILRSGSIESGFASNARALEGTRLHQKLQKAEKEGYEKEVVFQKTVPLKDYENGYNEHNGRCAAWMPHGEEKINE